MSCRGCAHTRPAPCRCEATPGHGSRGSGRATGTHQLVRSMGRCRERRGGRNMRVRHACTCGGGGRDGGHVGEGSHLQGALGAEMRHGELQEDEADAVHVEAVGLVAAPEHGRHGEGHDAAGLGQVRAVRG